MKFFSPLLVSLIIASVTVPAGATDVLNKEGVIGATTGGVAGGVIGHQSGHKTGGAIIGSVAGYAIGTTLHRQKQRQKQLERERKAIRQHVQEQTATENPPPASAPSAPARPELTESEKQQLLLQATPLFSVKRAE